MKQNRCLNPWVVWVGILIPGLIFNAISFLRYREADNSLSQVELYQTQSAAKFEETMTLMQQYEECVDACIKDSDKDS